MPPKVACIIGVTSQDGSYLTELLLKKGYKVIGVRRRVSTSNLQRIEHLLHYENLVLEYGDVTDYNSIFRVLTKYGPDEIYNLAAMSQVGISFQEPFHSFDVTAKGHLNVLECVRELKSRAYNPKIYFAASSECFGTAYSTDKNGNSYQDENTKFCPQSPYAIAKVAAFNFNKLYRHSYNIYTCSGILFNHSSPRRGEEFVGRKISKYVAKLYHHLKQNMNIWHLDKKDVESVEGYDLIIDNFPKLRLGNITTYRDWGYSKDYVNAMWLMLQQKESDDYVICTEETHSVEDFVKTAFDVIGIQDYRRLIIIDHNLFRVSEVPYLCGRYTKAKEKLKWKPTVKFKDLVHMMVSSDIQNYEKLQRP